MSHHFTRFEAAIVSAIGLLLLGFVWLAVMFLIDLSTL